MAKKLDKKAYNYYESKEPKAVVKKEVSEATKKLGRKATHKDAEKYEPMTTKVKEAAKGRKMMEAKKKKK